MFLVLVSCLGKGMRLIEYCIWWVEWCIVIVVDSIGENMTTETPNSPFRT